VCFSVFSISCVFAAEIKKGKCGQSGIAQHTLYMSYASGWGHVAREIIVGPAAGVQQG